MLDRFHSLKNRPRLHAQSCDGTLNKQNFDHKNQIHPHTFEQKHTSSRVRLRDFEILKESALSALVEKQEIIESLTSFGHEQLLQEIQQLIAKVQELEMQNADLKGALQEATRTLHEQRLEWNQEHFKLSEQIDYLKDALSEVETSVQQTLKKNGQLIVQNEQVWNEIHKIESAYKATKEQLINQAEEDIAPHQQDSNMELSSHSQVYQEVVKLEMGDSYSYQKVLFGNDMAQKNILIRDQEENEEDLSNIRKQLAYETQEWLEQPSLEASVREQHCLGRSLKAINLIDNYSINSKNNAASDSQSQFTYKYFRYTSQHHLAAFEKTLQESCEHIPEEPEEQLQASQHQIDKKSDDILASKWWERIMYLATGICAGAILVWKLKK